jgi:PTS system lactose-specific IIC component
MFAAMCAFMAKSQQLRAVGKTSIVPVLFAVNEPIIFGAPIVLNPVLFVPFIFAPILNVWLFKFFIENLGMNGFVYILPWTTPGTIGLILGTGFAKLSFILAPLLLLVDFIIYYPFFKVYDKQLVIREAENGGEVKEEREMVKAPTAAIKESFVQTVASENPDKELAVLVLCASGATSSMLAKSIAKGAKEKGFNMDSIAMAYGQHKEKITDFDLIVLAPQMASMYDELKRDCDAKGVKSATTSGKEYVKLTRESEAAFNFALNLIHQN